TALADELDLVALARVEPFDALIDSAEESFVLPPAALAPLHRGRVTRSSRLKTRSGRRGDRPGHRMPPRQPGSEPTMFRPHRRGAVAELDAVGKTAGREPPGLPRCFLIRRERRGGRRQGVGWLPPRLSRRGWCDRRPRFITADLSRSPCGRDGCLGGQLT